MLQFVGARPLSQEYSTAPDRFAGLFRSTAPDLECVQFHPTSLYLPGEAQFLLTEALSGKGTILRDADGRAFARDYHPDAELVLRD